MTCPTKEEIERRAREIYAKDCFRNGVPELADVNPETEELRENGCWSQAVSELMRDNPKVESVEWKGYNENLEAVVDFQFDGAEAMRTTSFISGSRGVGKSDIAMQIAEHLQNEGIIIIAFDPSCDWLKRSNIEKYITVKPYSDLPIPKTSTIFDISRLTPNQAQRSVEQFCKTLFDFQVDNSAKRFYIIFEESQIYFPLSALSSKNTQNTMRLLCVGRNFGVSMCAISQFPALVSKELIKHSQQVWIGCCAEPNTLKYWHGLIGKYSEKLKQLSNGQFVYYCRNTIGLTEIEPYECENTKTQIVIPQIKPIEPIRTTQNTNIIPFAKLFILLGFAVLVLSSLRGI
jgi:hypothetical protein